MQIKHKAYSQLTIKTNLQKFLKKSLKKKIKKSRKFLYKFRFKPKILKMIKHVPLKTFINRQIQTNKIFLKRNKTCSTLS